jgi:hypothetical protein
MPSVGRKHFNRLGYLLLAGLALANGGCLLVAAGAAGGAAACGYAYWQGRLYRDYPATPNDAVAAVRTALAELQFPPATEERDGDRLVMTTKTADGHKVNVHLDPTASRIPAEGTMTRVSVRVATFGDEAVSRRILDQVGFHLVQPARIAPVPTQPNPIQPTSASRPAETSPPPLLPAEPVKVK